MAVTGLYVISLIWISMQATNAENDAWQAVALIREIKQEIGSLHTKINRQQVQLDRLDHKIDNQQCSLDDMSIDKIVEKLQAGGPYPGLNPPTTVPRDCGEIYKGGSLDLVFHIYICCLWYSIFHMNFS